MNGLQYKNIVQWTTANTIVTDSLTGVKAIFNNMGVAFPNGTCEDVLKTLMTGEYMGWEACTAEQAQELANQGTAVVGVNTARAVVIMPDDRVEGIADKEQVAAEAVETASAASAATLAADTAAVQTVPYASTVSDISATDRMTMQFYSYTSSGTVTDVVPAMTARIYYNNIKSIALMPKSSDGTTYCNIWAQRVLARCGIPYPSGGCTSMLNQFNQGYSNWIEISNSQFWKAQSYANRGYATVAITRYHIAVVTPNNVAGDGATPTSIGQVLVSQSGEDSFYEKTLSNAWAVAHHPSIQFFYYNG